MLSPNLGDAISPYIIDKLGHRAIYTPPTEKCLIMSGSILNHAQKKSRILGSGLAWETDGLTKPRKIHSVRGWLTAKKVKEDIGIKVKRVGDPALIMPYLYNSIKEKKYKYGVLPHYIDLHKVMKKMPDSRVINILEDTESVIDQIAECEHIITSSLHGLIICDAYKIPNVWVKFSNNVLGDGFKFRDYFSTTNTKSKAVSMKGKINFDADYVVRESEIDVAEYFEFIKETLDESSN